MKKITPWIIMMFIAIVLIVLASFILWRLLLQDDPNDPQTKAQQVEQNKDSMKLSAKETKDLSVDMNDILTNLGTGEYVKANFTFVFSEKAAKEDFSLLDFKVKNAIINIFSDLTPEDLQGSKGKDLFISKLMNRINTDILTKGKVTDVNITSFVIS